MGGERLTLSVGGQLADAIRIAARVAGVTPAQWVGAVVGERLAADGPPRDEREPSAAPPTVPDEAGAGAARLRAAAAWQRVTDDTGTFSVSLPRGWRNRAWVVPTPVMKYPMATATSPDGRTTLFSGDARIPMFFDPASGMFPAPGTALRPPTEARQFLAEWARHLGGGRQAFRLLNVVDDPHVAQAVTAATVRAGSQYAWLTAARAEAEFVEDGIRRRAVYLAATMGLGPAWLAQVHGVTSSEDPAEFLAALLQLATSLESTPAEQQRLQAERMASDAQHQATMQSIHQNTAMMAAGHQQRMADLQASAIAHQQNLASRRAAFDAGVDSWRQQQAGSDAQHAAHLTGLRSGSPTPGAGDSSQLDFVNMINEERTVLDADGRAHQVAAGADRYYHHEHSNTWVGLGDHQDIVEVTGGNREDWQEGTLQS